MIMDYKEGEYRNFQESLEAFMKNYWGINQESVMKSKLYETKFNHSLRVSREEYVFFKQLEKEVLNKVKIIEVKKFDETVRILEIHYECGRDGVGNDGNEYYNHYNNYEQRKYNHSGQGRSNHNYSQRPYQENQFYYYYKNENSRSCGRNVNINKIIQRPRKNVDTIEGVGKGEVSQEMLTVHSSGRSDKWKKYFKPIQYEYFVEENLEDEVLKKNVGIEMNIINVNLGKDDKNDYVYEGNDMKVKICDEQSIV
ncbi:hypothetical protein FQA39_LY02735 [Lamprigera yunnana]|nr:hypothetical protein FQA39_LY02735 [Lamprigera yunnana]